MQITHEDYIKDSAKLHHSYYQQFVTPTTVSFIKSCIGLAALRASTDKHLNDVVPWENGGRSWLWDRSPINEPLARELGEQVSMSTRTCVGKAAARMILKGEA